MVERQCFFCVNSQIYSIQTPRMVLWVVLKTKLAQQETVTAVMLLIMLTFISTLNFATHTQQISCHISNFVYLTLSCRLSSDFSQLVLHLCYQVIFCVISQDNTPIEHLKWGYSCILTCRNGNKEKQIGR